MYLTLAASGYTTSMLVQRAQGTAVNETDSSAATREEDSAQTEQSNDKVLRGEDVTLVEFTSPTAATSQAVQNQPQPGATSVDQWILLCFDYYKYVGIATHVPIHNNSDDVALMSALKENYLRSRSWFNRATSWTEIKTIDLVKVCNT
jgi:uncharacterized protein CbrC (UPF0167 family)